MYKSSVIRTVCICVILQKFLHILVSYVKTHPMSYIVSLCCTAWLRVSFLYVPFIDFNSMDTLIFPEIHRDLLCQ